MPAPPLALDPCERGDEICTNEKPSPIPTMMKPGKRSEKYEPLAEIWANRRSPIVSVIIPNERIGFTPSLVTSACEIPEATTAVSATARYARPVWSAEEPSTCCI